MFRLLGCYAILNLQNVSQVVHHISNINLYFQLKHTPQIIILIVFATCCHHYDHCPVPMYLKCSDYFVFMSTNEILDIQMSHRQVLWFVTYFNCICYMLPTIWGKYMSVDYYIMIPNMFRLLGCYAILNLQNVSQVVASYIQCQPIFSIKT